MARIRAFIGREFINQASKLVYVMHIFLVIACIASGVFFSSCAPAAAQSRDQFDNEQLLDLMFPATTSWETLPIAKWPRAPSVLVVIESDLSRREASRVRATARSFEAKTNLIRLTFLDTPTEQEVFGYAQKSDITIIVGSDSIKAASRSYRDVLLLALPLSEDPDTAVAETIAHNRPALSKLKLDYASGAVVRVVTFVQSGPVRPDIAMAVSFGLLSALSPSFPAASQVSLEDVFTNSGDGVALTPAAISYLGYLYSSRVPMGSTRDKQRQIIMND